MHKIQWQLVIEPEVTTEYAQSKLGAYYTDIDVRLATEITSSRMFRKLYDYGSGEVEQVQVAVLFYTCASALGAKLVFPEDSSPQIKGRVIEELSGINKLKVPDDISAAGYIPQVIDDFRQLKKRSSANGIEPVFDLAGQSPLGTAIILRGDQIFLDMVTEPEWVKELLEIITETAIKIFKFQEEFTGKKLVKIGIDDDYGGLVSPELYEKFNYPYIKRMFDALGTEERHLHSETLAVGHLKYLHQLGITNYDSWPYHDLTVEIVAEKMGDMFFTWNCETTKDLFEDTPEKIVEKYKRAVSAGTPGMNLCLCARAVPRENIRAFVDIAKEVNNSN